jgi:hypothetical protein
MRSFVWLFAVDVVGSRSDLKSSPTRSEQQPSGEDRLTVGLSEARLRTNLT